MSFSRKFKEIESLNRKSFLFISLSNSWIDEWTPRRDDKEKRERAIFQNISSILKACILPDSNVCYKNIHFHLLSSLDMEKERRENNNRIHLFSLFIHPCSKSLDSSLFSGFVLLLSLHSRDFHSFDFLKTQVTRQPNRADDEHFLYSSEEWREREREEIKNRMIARSKNHSCSSIWDGESGMRIESKKGGWREKYESVTGRRDGESEIKQKTFCISVEEKILWTKVEKG